MTTPVRKIRFRGIGEYRDEAEPLLEQAGDAAGVFRGCPRSLLIKCPDGCGDTLVINLDPRSGKAWSLDARQGSLTLDPSVWREDGCRSHFILWRDHILWCGRFEDGNREPLYDPALEETVRCALDHRRYRSPQDIALELGEIRWEVLRTLRRLVRNRQAEEGTGVFHEKFRLPDGPRPRLPVR